MAREPRTRRRAEASALPRHLTLARINAELARRGHNLLLGNGGGYFYFHTGEAADWIDRTVQVPKVNSLTLDEWIQEYERLKRLNEQIRATAAGKPRRERWPQK